MRLGPEFSHALTVVVEARFDQRWGAGGDVQRDAEGRLSARGPQRHWHQRTGCGPGVFVSQKVFLKYVCKSQFPHKSINLFFILVMIKDAKRIYTHFLRDKFGDGFRVGSVRVGYVEKGWGMRDQGVGGQRHRHHFIRLR